MAYNINFYRGLEAALPTTRDANSFYITTDTGEMYLGSKKLTSQSELTAAIARIATNEADIATLKTNVGTLTSLTTEAQSSLVDAINEVAAKIASAQSTGTVAVTTAATTTEGYLKTYSITQGGTEVGKIDIPKDLVVTAGEVVELTEGEVSGLTAGTYIKLTIANQEAPIYISVKDLVDLYTAAENATQVQIAVSSTNEISATLVASGITATELAADAVTTVKILDANVTKAKLATDVQTSLGLADTAVQNVTASDATTGTDGTITVDGTEVAVKGYSTLASDVSTLKNAVGSGGSIEGEIIAAIEALDVTDTAVDGQYVSAVSETDGKITVTRASLPDYSGTYDAKGAAETAETNAKSYTDTALTWQTFTTE